MEITFQVCPMAKYVFIDIAIQIPSFCTLKLPNIFLYEDEYVIWRRFWINAYSNQNVEDKKLFSWRWEIMGHMHSLFKRNMSQCHFSIMFKKY